MIYCVGDTHGALEINKLSTSSFPQQKKMTKEDYVIICGDFGLIWNMDNEDKYWLEWLSNKPFTTLFVDGNHENFDMLYNFPVQEKFGGLVREVAENVYHLCRGNVFTINGKKIFAMGGATSIDKEIRKSHINWWPQEIPSYAEMDWGLYNLENNNWEVDYVISHCAPSFVFHHLFRYNLYEKDALNRYFDMIAEKLTFKKWYFGHYHIDRVIGDKYYALYNNITEVV